MIEPKYARAWVEEYCMRQLTDAEWATIAGHFAEITRLGSEVDELATEVAAVFRDCRLE